MPYPSQDFAHAKGAARVADEEAHEREFGRSQHDPVAAPPHEKALLVENEVANRRDRTDGLVVDAVVAQRFTDPRHRIFDAEWLDQPAVGAYRHRRARGLPV